MYAFQQGFAIYIGVISMFTFVISKVDVFIVMCVVYFSCAKCQKHVCIAVISMTVLQEKGNKSYRLRSLSTIVVVPS